MVTVDIQEEELLKVQPICDELGLPYPTTVSDVYKNRGGRYTSIKIFRQFDKGTCRMRDLFITSEFHELIDLDYTYQEEVEYYSMEKAKEVLIDEFDGPQR